MTPSETNASFEAEIDGSLPLRVIERGRREKDFFDNYSDPTRIVDEMLIVPKELRDLDLPIEILRLAPLLSGKSVCDFGCGYGVTAAFFALQRAATYALDISNRNISIAKRTALVNGVHDRVFLKEAQGENTGYPNDFFDFVFGKAILHHLDIPLAAREVCRILKPGGAAAFCEPFGENKLLERIRNSSWRSLDHRHTVDERNIRYSDLASLQQCFERVNYREAGLSSVVKTVCRRLEVGMIALPRGGAFLDALDRCDRWFFRRLPPARWLAQHIVILMYKPGNISDVGWSLRAVAKEFHHSEVI